jgi:fructosamine-3-kinase
MISKMLEKLVVSIIEKKTGRKQNFQCSRPLGGGDINQAAKIETQEGIWFVKWNRADSFPGMFEAEAIGLDLLRETNEISVPKVIGTGQTENISVLVLEYLESARQIPGFSKLFGQQLASMHKHSNVTFGLDHNNYIGSLPQNNTMNDNWIDFFINQRLLFQGKLAVEKGRAGVDLLKQIENLSSFLPDFFSVEPPSLLHGDLWGGNYMVGNNGEPAIIDPAVYYGHRLMDIGMSKLFGGFSQEFYQAYNEEYPLQSNWQQAVEIANLYPLLVHVNLFGGGYLSSVKSILRRF